MSKALKISNDLSLPIETVTQTIAILAKRRAGKSYAMRRLTEQLFKAGQQIVLVDPKGDQWGIRSSADGKGPGLPVVILGGERADVPLEVGAGEIVAKLVVEERVSVLLDLSIFRKHEVATFMTVFLENLYRLKAREIYRTPMMLVIDEADAIAPQKPQKGEERMLGAAEDIVRRGGQRGIGCTLVTQRSAVLNKNVLTQAQMLVALRTIAPQDLTAMDAWIQVHGDSSQQKTLMESLPALPTGDAWFWSPGWPTVDGIFKRVHVLPIETFDSGATPKPGEHRVEPKQVADVDLESLKRQMAATIERKRAEDPKELRRQITDLKKQLASKSPIVDQRTVDSALDRQEREHKKEKEGLIAAYERALEELRDRLKKIGALSSLDGVTTWVRERQQALALPKVARHIPNHISSKRSAAEIGASKVFSQNGNGHLPPAKQKILNGLAFLDGIGVSVADKTQLALIVGVSPTSGGYFNNLGSLRSEGLIEYPTGGSVSLTDSGREIARTDGIPSNTQELHDAIRQKLPPAKWRILEALIEVYPDSISKDALAERIEVSPTSGGYFNNLGSLRSLGLIDYPQPGAVIGKPVLFLRD